MAKTILYIEDRKKDFYCFKKILEEEGFIVKPDAYEDFRGLYEKKEGVNRSLERMRILKEELFEKLLENNFFQKIDLIILDINLLGGNDSEDGLEVLKYIREDFSEKIEDNTHKIWGKIVPCIFLTVFKAEKYKNKSIKKYGTYPYGYYEKGQILNVRDSQDLFIADIRNAIAQKEAHKLPFSEPTEDIFTN